MKELIEKRNALVLRAREIVEAAQKEKRGMSAEETANYDAAMSEIAGLGAAIERGQRLEAIEAELRESTGTAAGRPPVDPGAGDGGAVAHNARPEYRAAFARWLTFGREGVSGPEMRALAADTDSAGGFLVTPLQLVQTLIAAIKNQVFMRNIATVMQLQNAANLGVPTLATDASDPTWTTEVLTGADDSALAFGRRDLKPEPLAKRIKVSKKLLRQAPNSEAVVVERFGYKFAVAEENGYLNGDGSGKPLGVFVADANGIPTGRDVSAGNTATAVTFDGLIAAKYSVKPGYWPRAQWIFHRDAIKQLAQVKDSTGQYVWQPSKASSEPDRLLGHVFNVSEYAPNTFTTGLYVGMFGDFSYYHIAESLNMEMQRLVELYAETNQVGFIGRREVDGMPVLAEAFARVKLA